jgi:hypothetical protein
LYLAPRASRSWRTRPRRTPTRTPSRE